jgi:hypothetical protein
MTATKDEISALLIKAVSEASVVIQDCTHKGIEDKIYMTDFYEIAHRYAKKISEEIWTV